LNKQTNISIIGEAVMKNILVIESSVTGGTSHSRKLTHEIVEKLTAQHADANVKIYDLVEKSAPHLDPTLLAAFFTPPEKQTDAHKQMLAYSEEAIADLMNADVIVIGAPMYNFSIPSVLKAWIDNIARAGRTFRYSEHGPEGLVKGKKVFLAVASGGIYSEGMMKPMDFVEPYLRAVFSFLGMTDVTTIRVEGVAIPDVKETAFEKAVQSLKIAA